MTRHSVCAKPSPVSGLAVWMALLLGIPTNAEARGIGQDWYLISREGRLTRRLESKEGDVVDADAGLFYRLENNALSANRFEDGAAKWSLQRPVPNPHDGAFGALVPSDSDVLTILAHGFLNGYSKRTGKELYRTAVGTPLGTFGLPRNFYPGFAWGVNANGEDGRYLYLTREKTELVVHTNGWVEAIAVQPPALAKLDIRTGAEMWERSFNTNVVVESVSPGTMNTDHGPVYFDPKTGDVLTNVLAGAELLFAGKIGFYISRELPGTLTTIEVGTQKVLWKIEQLDEVRKICEPYAYDRLLCATDSRVIVIDTVHRRIKAEFPLPGLNSVRFLQTKRFLIAQSYEAFRAINPETGGTLWDLKTGNAIRTPMFKGGDDQVLIAERESYEQDRKARFDVVALAIETGKPLWRWRVPDGPWGDQVGVTIRPCPAGFAICRHWTILD